MKALGKYFTYNELTHTNCGLINVPNKEQTDNLIQLVANVLDPLRELYNKPIKINSGFRSELVNKFVKGANNSDHLYGFAADLDCGSKAENKILFNLIRENFTFKQLINDKNYSWVHVSFDPDNIKNQLLAIS